MGQRESEDYRGLAEAAWRWVLGQVREDDGPWIPSSVADDTPGEPPEDRDGMHSGIGGLAHVLAEVRQTRPWTDEEGRLADAVSARLLSSVDTATDPNYFDGLVSTIGALVALDRPDSLPAVERALARLAELATPDGWPQGYLGPPRYRAEARCNDLTLGTAGVLAGAVWAGRHGAAGARALADRAAEILLAEAEPLPTGTSWRFVPARFHLENALSEMPNLSHGQAGIVAALASAGADLDRPDLVDAARSGAEHLVTLADRSDGGFLVPRTVPHTNLDYDEVTYTWCHGPAGTSTAFLALDRAGVTEVAGASPLDWHRRCLHTLRTSGLPDRRYPGFWDNDGRCCGTAGVGDVLLDAWQRLGVDDDLAFAVELADTLVERAVRSGPVAWWQFLEHRVDPPLLPPGVGWMQGAAGIAAYLFRVARLVDDPGRATTVPRMDTWWCLPERAAGA